MELEILSPRYYEVFKPDLKKTGDYLMYFEGLEKN